MRAGLGYILGVFWAWDFPWTPRTGPYFLKRHLKVGPLFRKWLIMVLLCYHRLIRIRGHGIYLGRTASQGKLPEAWEASAKLENLAESIPQGPYLKPHILGISGLEGLALLQINMELTWNWRGAHYKTTILYIGPCMSFHVNLGEGRHQGFGTLRLHVRGTLDVGAYSTLEPSVFV